MNRDGQHDDDGDGGLHLVSISRSQWTLGNGQLGTIQFSAQLRVAAVKEKNSCTVMTLVASMSLNPPASPSTPFRFLLGRPAESSPSFRTRAT
jgi:hypothetical protein